MIEAFLRTRWSVLAALAGIFVVAGVWWQTNEESVEHRENETTKDELPASDVEKFDDIVGGVSFPEARSDIPVVELGTDEITINGRTAWELQSFDDLVDEDSSSGEIWRLREEPIDGVVDELRAFLEVFYDKEEQPTTVELRFHGEAQTFWLDRVLASLQAAGIGFVSLHLPAWFEVVLPELTAFEDNNYFIDLTLDWFQTAKYVFDPNLPYDYDGKTKDWLEGVVNGSSVGLDALDRPEMLEGSQARDVLRSIWEKGGWTEWFPELEAHLLSEGDRVEQAEERSIVSEDWADSYALLARADLPIWITLGVAVQYQAGLEHAYRELKPEYIISSPVWFRRPIEIEGRDILWARLQRRIPTEEIDVEVRAQLMDVAESKERWIELAE